MFLKLLCKLLRKLYKKWEHHFLKMRTICKTFLFRLLYIYILGIVEGGENITVYQWVSIKGPGKIKLGRNVRFGYPFSPSFSRCCIEVITKFSDSCLMLADNCTINNNNRFVVVNNISFSERCKTGHDVQVFDSDMHSTDIELRHTGGDRDGRPGDVVLEENVMIGALVAIGPDTLIGKNSVVGMGSILKRRRYAADSIIVGNPARAVKLL